MIEVVFVREAEGKRITSFTISGHANYAKSGKDIVCAGVSAVSVGTVNAIESLLGVQLPAVMKNGWLSADIPQQEEEGLDAQVQLLLESMRVMLDSIAASYKKFVVVKQVNH